MQNILLHGLGQNKNSFDSTKEYFKKDIFLTPDLYELIGENEANYNNLYASFCKYCNCIEGQLNLCGLSLGGVLALNYAADFPQKVNSIILIGVPYKIPRFLFFIQGVVFKILPKKTFQSMGMLKEDFIGLVNSMKKIRISEMVKKVNRKTLILCGIKDKVNQKSARYLTENIKDSKFDLVNRSSHEVNKDNPKELAQRISDFFALDMV